MNTIRNTIIAVGAGLLSCLTLSAQDDQAKHEFSVWGAGGLSSLKYKSTVGSHTQGFGGQIGVGYTYFFSPHLGLGSGVEIGLYNAKTKFDKLSDKYITTDIDGKNFEFRTTVSNYQEKQSAMYLHIPLMLHYQTTGKSKFYAAAGGKVGIPISGKYKVSGTTYSNSGFYELEQYEYTDENWLGFGEFKGRSTKEDLDLKLAFMLSAEAGMKWQLGETMSLYTGAYMDYGLNDVNKASGKHQFVAYNTESPIDFKNNSILSSGYHNNGKAETMTDKVNLLSAGVKIKLAFGKGRVNKVVETFVAPPPAPLIEREPEPIIDQNDEKTLAEVRRQLEEKQAARDKQAAEEREQLIRIDIAKVEKEPLTGYTVDQVGLSKEAQQEIDQKIAILKQHSQWRVECIGHTCNLGSDAVNERIAQQRAEVARDYLIEKGIAANRITIVSKGATAPVAGNTTEKERQKNRRVEIKVSPPNPPEGGLGKP